ncbi:MAG TPA: hypothetical protein VK589_12625 [Chryseolinea sp.]|nr:hypothetical protein [Chryseolinea sp.]
MKSTVLILLITTLFYSPIVAQEDDKTWFDFWVGKWEGSWTESDGKIGRGTNTITRTLDNTVIQENFKVDEGTSKGYLGTSISVYNPQKKTWHQGYADNQGSYFNLIGERQGDRRIFRTEMIQRGEKRIFQRMVFYDITENTMVWDWESTQDGGKTWTLNWRINYKRIKS